MMVETRRGTRDGVRLVVPCIGALVGGVALVLAFAGCGANGGGPAAPATGDQVQAGEDVLLFSGGEEPSKSMSQPDVSKAPAQDKNFWLVMSTNGHFYHNTVPNGLWHGCCFDTLAGRVYQVEVCSLTWQDDPDIYIGRSPSMQPNVNHWKASTRLDQYMDGIVFKATQTGRMYVIVHGWDDGSGDGYVDYSVHARRAQFAQFSQ